jgi:hypothetical protein
MKPKWVIIMKTQETNKNKLSQSIRDWLFYFVYNSVCNKEFCPTIDSKYTTYNNLYNKGKEEGEEEKDSQGGVYVVESNPMVGQNKKTLLKDEKIAVITQAIKQLMGRNQKITIRKIQEVSGVAKATVEKHYKAILADLSQDIEIDNIFIAI